MKFFESIRLGTVVLALTLFGSCQESEDLLLQNEENPMLISGQNDFESKHKGFVHGIVIPVDGEDYYFDGPPDGPGGATDIPGHTWVQAGPNQLVGKHYNTGPLVHQIGGHLIPWMGNICTKYTLLLIPGRTKKQRCMPVVVTYTIMS